MSLLVLHDTGKGKVRHSLNTIQTDAKKARDERVNGRPRWWSSRSLARAGCTWRSRDERTCIERTVPYPSVALLARCRPPGRTILRREQSRHVSMLHKKLPARAQTRR